MSKRVITCTPASRPFGRPLTRYEITDRTVVRLHEESRHLSVSSVKVVSGSGGDESSENSVQADDDRLRYSFYVNKLDDKNNVSFLEFSTASDEIRTTWKELMITTKKEYIREQEIRIYGNDTHRLVKWKINRDSLSSSKNVSEMLSLTGLISMKSSTLLDRKITEDQQIGNVPDSATHFRWFHANAGRFSYYLER